MVDFKRVLTERRVFEEEQRSRIEKRMGSLLTDAKWRRMLLIARDGGNTDSEVKSYLDDLADLCMMK